ncbi:hypothetical protein [Seongchinamella unica]|nr:hypothetical protein [Seongchinamella unica]
MSIVQNFLEPNKSNARERRFDEKAGFREDPSIEKGSTLLYAQAQWVLH